MKHVVLYILGAPGSGKTTLARALLGVGPFVLTTPKWTVGEQVCAAGHYTGAMFDGTDTIPYAGARAALSFWQDKLAHVPLTILDGTRLASAPSLEFLQKTRHAIIGAHLTCTLAAERRKQRGTLQDPTWVRGATTRAANFAKKIGAMELDSTLPVERLAATVLDWIEAARSDM